MADGRAARRPWSIGARWTLRFSAAILISLSALSFYAYTRIQVQAARDGRLLLEHQATSLLARVKQGFENVDELGDYIINPLFP